ncbi:hypothetical protein WwSim0452 [Wolbachia endosymbiont of Drosophila simulans]|nr:hypothetical protein WwSim0452 [Wolbachia endosymbiont of Drosophila simulans]
MPAYSETIAISRLAKKLNRVDLPTFGSPVITICKPSRNLSPRLLSFKCSCINRTRDCTSLLIFSNSLFSAQMSSGKSIYASILDCIVINLCLQLLYSLSNSPDICLIACLACIFVSASIKSAIPSICVKSNLPFRKALSENSPGLAITKTFDNSSKMIFITALLPCTCNSITSSPVKLFGAGK